MSDQQMRYEQTLYPVDRYLVESSKQIDMINIIDDDIWNPEPALRPEDEIILGKLHDMLQSTADDLKLLSGELSKYHESGVQKKTLPTPLDEEFNEKVHIEEVVNAKFLGHKIIDSVQVTPKIVQKDSIVNEVVKSIVSKRNTKNVNLSTNQVPSARKTSRSNLGISRTKVFQILEDHSNDEKQTLSKKVEEDFSGKKNKTSCVAYNEFSHIEDKPIKINLTPKKCLQVQNMPSVNIRRQLQEQKVLQLDILPNSTDLQEIESVRNNALVIELKHEPVQKLKVTKPTFDHIKIYPTTPLEKPVTRKISKMSVYESSESTNNASSEYQQHLRTEKLPSRLIGTNKSIKNIVSRKERRSKSNLDEWKNKLNSVYGPTTKTSGVKFKKPSPKRSSTKRVVSTKKSIKGSPNINVEYIPYTKLTLGGVNVSDIEREISSIPNRNNIVLSPILDKILSSRENSFHTNSPIKNKKESPKILTTSDENLLQEVLNIEKQVTQTISENNRIENKILKNVQSSKSDSSKASDSYIDDFEDDKSFECDNVEVKKLDSLNGVSPKSDEDKNLNDLGISGDELNEQHNTNIYNKTFTKVSNLSLKHKVDIFEFLPDTQDTGAQSLSSKIKPQETQTSPKNDNSLQSIRNDLWASIDPRGEVEKMFKLEKDFITKLIIEEYGDLLEKQLNKPSTSKDTKIDITRNVSASQKNTQTSPAHVKSVMTSPKQTKTRTTSPFALSLNVNKQTSPLVIVSNEEQLKVELEEDDDLGISVNLSSPRFSLRLPQSRREILSNVHAESMRYKTTNKFDKNLRRYISSSSSVDGDYSSSDISSIGEIHKKYKRRLRKVRIPSLTELSSPSSLSRCTGTDHSDIVPLKSDGEASLGQLNRQKRNVSKSEGEMSLGQIK